MGLFTKYVNVEDHLQRIGRLLKVNGNQTEIDHHLKEIKKYVLLVLDQHKLTLHPYTVEKLTNVLTLIASAERGMTPPVFENLKQDFSRPFTATRVYLMRHPEKVGKLDADSKRKNLSLHGVKQARNFAQYLMEEVLLCPRPVRVILQCSDLRRSWLYAETIRRKMVEAALVYKKDVSVGTGEIAQHPALYFRFSKDCLAAIDEVYRKNELEAFTQWISGRHTTCPDSNRVVAELGAWIKEGLQRQSADAWTIVIGISHSFIIDAYLLARTKDHNSIIATADYAQFVGSDMYYKHKWY